MNAARGTARLLPGGRIPRLHLQDGPIGLVIFADGPLADVERAYGAARLRFLGILDRLCAELPLLRRGVDAQTNWPHDPIARRMRAAVDPFARFGFITPMAAVAGAVAEAVLQAMTESARLRRAAVNNGGDIALHLAADAEWTIGMIARPELLAAPPLFGTLRLRGDGIVRGIATSGWRGRSFSRGIADAVTVLAARAAEADAAATVIANAVDLPGHRAIRRCAAASLQPDSDLGDIAVTCAVETLSDTDIDAALRAGLHRAEAMIATGEIVAAALHLQGETRIAGQAS